MGPNATSIPRCRAWLFLRRGSLLPAPLCRPRVGKGPDLFPHGVFQRSPNALTGLWKERLLPPCPRRRGPVSDGEVAKW